MYRTASGVEGGKLVLRVERSREREATIVLDRHRFAGVEGGKLVLRVERSREREANIVPDRQRGGGR